MSSEINEVKVKIPLGILEIIYEKHLINMIRTVKELEINYNRDQIQTFIVYPSFIALWCLVFKIIEIITTGILHILSSSIGVLALSLLFSILTVETIRNDSSLYDIYSNGKLSLIRKVSELEYEPKEIRDPKIVDTDVQVENKKENLNAYECLNNMTSILNSQVKVKEMENPDNLPTNDDY